MRFRQGVFHPFLLVTFPIAALLATNVEQVRLSDAIRSILLSLAGVAVLLLLLKVALKDWRRAALVCALAIVLFFSYGHVYSTLKAQPRFGLLLGRHRYLIPLWFGLFASGLWWSLQKRRDLPQITIALNLMGLVLLVQPLLKIASFELGGYDASSGGSVVVEAAAGVQVAQVESMPDIYYIILDGYTREDVLQKAFAYDNKPFIDQLQEWGFYVAQRSQSNYAQTELSLASSLNMNYLDSLGERFVPESDDRSPLWPLLRHSTARTVLEDLGYTTVAFETGYNWTQWEDADFYLTRTNSSIRGLTGSVGMNAFEALLVRSSAALILVDASAVLPKFLVPDVNYPFKSHRERILFVLDRLRGVISLRGPKFVFVHIVSPHYPFVFDANGDLPEQTEAYSLRLPDTHNDPESYIKGYRDQVNYLNQRILELVDEILSRTQEPPVIIIQGDHGADIGGRMTILNAYYMPEAKAGELYPEITPVNSFRALFNGYFGSELPELEDRSYYSVYSKPYEFTLVPNEEAK